MPSVTFANAGHRRRRTILRPQIRLQTMLVAIAVLCIQLALQYLDVSETGLTDDAVVRLAPLCNLAGLNIRGTQISDGGFKRLQRALPECQICR